MSVVAPLAPHASNLQDMLAQLQSNPPGEEVFERAHRAIADGTTTSAFRENVMREIRQLSQTVLQIEQHFSEIAHSIRAIDSKRALKDENGLEIQFYPDWNSYCELYSSLLHSSQTTATELKVTIDDMIVNLIPLINNPHVSLHDKQEELRGFIQGLHEFQTLGADNAREFQQLCERVKNFGHKLTRETRSHRTKVRERLEVISENISRLEAELKASEGFFSACWSVFNLPTFLGAISLSTGVSGFTGLIALAPVASTLLVVGGLGALGYGISKGLNERERKMQGKKDAILALRSEQESLQAQQEDLQEISAEVMQLASKFAEIVDRLGAIQQIWTMIKSDAVGLQRAMTQLENARTIAGFNARIRNIEQLWNTLAWALDNYALGVSVAFT